jgi:predicted nucleic acid-binding protein
VFLFDTDVLSNLMSARPSARLLGRLGGTPAEHQATSAITAGELIYGAFRSPRPAHFREKLERVVWPRVRVLSFDRRAAEEYGRIRTELEKAGSPIPDADMMIAAIAASNGLTLVTGNVRHFARIRGLIAENWL